MGDVCDPCFGTGPLDTDGDDLCDPDDNCPLDQNPVQDDSDGDGLGDACDPCFGTGPLDTDVDNICDPDDNCPVDQNPVQSDSDSDGVGDACDQCFGDGEADMDLDGICDGIDLCPTVADPAQVDCDDDGDGDACDLDTVDGDGDGVADACDNCPAVANPEQADFAGDGQGDACTDSDGDGTLDVDDDCPGLPSGLYGDSDDDGVGDGCDNCVGTENPDQGDFDGDGFGDACDTCAGVSDPAQVDCDNDGVGDACDFQTEDTDGDGIDDACDLCAGEGAGDGDGDAICDLADNCPEVANVTQADGDLDGFGDACQPFVDISAVLEDGGSNLEVTATVSNPRPHPLFGTVAAWQGGLPSAMSFTWMATDCTSLPYLLYFRVNGEIVATVENDPDNSCNCVTPAGARTVAVPFATYYDKVVPGVNTLSVEKDLVDGNGILAWVYATLTIDGMDTQVGLFDEPGGTEPSYGIEDVCVANYTGSAVNASAPTPSLGTVVATANWTQGLPCSLDLAGLPAGPSMFVVTARDSLPGPSGKDYQAFALSTESVALINDASSCSDGNACTAGDTCVAGACTSSGPVDCDDADPCTQDSCDPDSGCANAAEPPPVCIESPNASIDVRNGADDEDDSIAFRMQKGDAFNQAFLGTPATTTTYALCLYDRSAGEESIAGRLVVDPNVAWVDKDPKGLNYNDKTGAEDGLQRIQIKTGVSGKTSVQVRGKGVNVVMPAPLDLTRYFTQDPTISAVLLHDGGACWRADFDATSTSRNDPLRFKAKKP